MLKTIVFRRCAQLMVPMLCWQALYHLIPPYKGLSFGSFIDCGVYWFLWALFFITVIFVFAEYIASKSRLQAWIVHIIIILILLGVMVLLDYREHGVQYISYYYPYYVFGSYYHQKMSNKDIHMPFYYLGLMVWFILALFWDMHKPPVFLSTIPLPSSIICFAYRYFVAFLAVFVFYGLARRFLSKKNLFCSMFEKLGVLSLGIYTIHIVLIKLERLIIPRSINVNDTLLITSIWLIVLLLSYLIALVLKRNRIFSFVLLGKIKK